MTQPPDERDPLAPEPGPASGEPPAAGPDTTPESPTQAWSPEPPPSAPGPAPASTVGWGALPPNPTGAPDAPAASPLISAEPAAAGGGTSWALPPTPAAREVAPGLVWADTPSRFVAYLVDSILLGIVASVITSVAGVQQTAGQFGQAVDARSSIVVAVVSTAVSAAYFILFWSGGRRATLGQMLFKIQVGNAFDGNPLTMNQAVKRWIGLGSFLSLLAVVPAFGLAALIQLVWSVVLLVTTVSSPTKQGLHDKFANSAVVRPAGAGTGLAIACLVILLALILLPIVALIFVGGQVSSILSEVGQSV
jgi:uncharacterized RDD family membrane protein YckC